MEVENNYKQSSDFQVYYFIKQEQSWGNNKGYYNNSAGYKKGNVIQFFNHKNNIRFLFISIC